MFQKITNDLINAAAKLESEKVIMAAPIYLLPQKDYSNAMLRYSLEQLVIELDKHGVISEKDAAVINLYAENGSSDIVNSVQPGFYNDFGKFKRTLEQWLGDVVQIYHVNQGIVLISFPPGEGYTLRRDMERSAASTYQMLQKPIFVFSLI